MKVNIKTGKRPRIEMLPLIDIVFLLLVFFIYAMLSMAVHKGLPVTLPSSATAETTRTAPVSITLKADGSIFLDKIQVPLENIAHAFLILSITIKMRVSFCLLIKRSFISPYLK